MFLDNMNQEKCENCGSEFVEGICRCHSSPKEEECNHIRRPMHDMWERDMCKKCGKILSPKVASWEEEFKDFYWEKGKYKGRELGIDGYISFISSTINEVIKEEREKTKELLLDMKKYIIQVEEAEAYESNFGEHICYQKLEKYGRMPELYYEIINFIKSNYE